MYYIQAKFKSKIQERLDRFFLHNLAYKTLVVLRL